MDQNLERHRSRLVGLEADELLKPGKKPAMWVFYLPLAILLIALIAGGVYYLMWQKRQVSQESRLEKPAEAQAMMPEDVSAKRFMPAGADIPQHTELNKAILLYQRGYAKPASAAFLDIVESSAPENVKSFALVYLGIIADEEGRFNLSLDYFNRALRFDPENFYAHYNMAITLQHKGMNKEALDALEIAQKLRPDLVDARVLKGQIQYQSDDLQSAEATLRSVNNDPLGMYNLAMVYKKEGKLAEAKASFLEALNMAVTGEIAAKSAAQLGVIHGTQGDYANARVYLEKAIALAPQNPRYYYNLALVEHNLNNPEAALRNLRQAVALGEKNPQTFIYVANLYSQLGEMNNAENALRLAVEQTPMDTVILAQLADLLIQQKKWNSALEVLHKIERISSKTLEKAQALYNLGRVYSELKDWENSRKSLERSYQLDATNEDSLVALGDTYYRQGAGHRSIALFKEALRLNPDNIRVLRALSNIYLELGLLTEAEDTLKRLTDHPLRRDEDVYFAYQSLGKIFKDRKVYDISASYYEKVLNAPDPQMRYNAYLELADAILQAERPSTLAMEHLQKAIAMKPEAVPARLLLVTALIREGSIKSQDRAEEEIAAVLELNHDPLQLSKAYTLRGIIHYKQGFFAKAVDDFDRALELDPANQQAFQNKRTAASRLE